MAGSSASNSAATLKDEGNSLFKAGSFLKAAAKYTQAIKLDPENATLYSNRSASFLQLSKISRALTDAETAITLKPEWDKGYFRKGIALDAMSKFEEALESYKTALDLNPSNKELLQKVKNTQRQLRDQKRSQELKVSRGGKPSFPDSPRKQRLLDFEIDFLSSLRQSLQKGEEIGEASFSVLFEDKDKDGKDKITKIVAPEAFDSPNTFTDFISNLRQNMEKLSPLAGILVAQKSKIAFPQVWKNNLANDWKYCNEDGIFVQLESKVWRKVWFFSVQKEGGKPPQVHFEELKVDIFAILQPVFR